MGVKSCKNGYWLSVYSYRLLVFDKMFAAIAIAAKGFVANDNGLRGDVVKVVNVRTGNSC